MVQKYTLEDLEEIVDVLRSEDGCPWDRKQTHKSLKPYIMEEAAELVASIRIYDTTGNPENMQEELGDILLHVVMHSKIAKEEGLFTMEDVIRGISEKMIRRHPRIFSKGAEEYDSWDEIKRKEKEGKDWIESPLKEIPKELPALTRAAKVIKKADKLYGAGRDYKDNVKQLEESAGLLSGFQPEEEDGRLEETLADILMSVADIAGQYHISLEQILTDRIENMIDRYESPGNPEK